MSGQFRMIILKLRVPRLFLLFRVGCLRLLCTASVLTVLLAARLPLAADGPEGLLRETHWGESSSELLHTFGGEATRLPRGLDFGDSYADIVLTRYALGGVPMVVFFQMDKATHGLKRIQLERPRHAVNPPSFRAITAKLPPIMGNLTRFASSLSCRRADTRQPPRRDGHAMAPSLAPFSATRLCRLSRAACLALRPAGAGCVDS